jgi:sialic acid synthase SpsE
MMGTGVKEPLGPEIKNRTNNRKSVVAAEDIKKGVVFSAHNISIKRPGSGMEPKHYYDILGKRAARDIKEDELIEWKDVY